MSKHNEGKSTMAGFPTFRTQFLYYYFLLHIPITLLIDSAVIIPPKLHIADWLLSKHVELNNDFLLWDRPRWLQAFVTLELVVQLPLFFRFVKQLRQNYIDRGSLKLYGALASTTTLVCIGAILEGHYPGSSVPLSVADKTNLVCVYFPTFAIPFSLVFL